MKHKGQEVWRYDLNRTQSVQYGDGHDIEYLTDVQQIFPTNQTPFPAVSFTYETRRVGTDTCPNPDWQYDIPYLKRVENGYGAVYEFTYSANDFSRWSGMCPGVSGAIRSHYVTDLKMWDGVDNVHGVDSQPSSWITHIYDPNDACFGDWYAYAHNGQSYTNPCYTEDEDSPKLVGFEYPDIKVTEGDGTTTRSYTKQDYIIYEELFRGEIQSTEQYDPDNNTVRLTHTGYLRAVNHATYCPNTNLVIDFGCMYENYTHHYDYTYGTVDIMQKERHYYEPYNQSNAHNRQYGIATKHESINTYDIVEQRQVTRYQRKDGTTYLLILPWMQRVEDRYATYPYLARTLMLYDGQTDPDSQTWTKGNLTLSRTQRDFIDQDSSSSTATYKTIDSSYTYDSYGNPETSTTYEDYGTVKETFGSGWTWGSAPGNGSTATTNTTTYIDYGQKVDNIENALGHTTTFSYNNTDFPWLLTNATDPNGLQSRYSYDVGGRLTKVERQPSGGSWEEQQRINYTLDTNAPGDPVELLEIEQVTGYGSSTSQTSKSFYNGLGQLVQQRQLNHQISGTTNSTIRQLFSYDASGRQNCSSIPKHDSSSGFVDVACAAENSGHTSTTYDGLGRQIAVTAPDGSSTQYRYGVYNDNGVIFHHTNVLDSNRHWTQQRTDSLGKLTAVSELTGNCGFQWTGYSCGGSYNTPWAEYARTTYSYDLLGNLIQVEDEKGNDTIMTYDSVGRKLTMDDPDMGEWTYAYDPSGNLTNQLDGENQRLCFYYDELSRITGKAIGGSNCPSSMPAYPDPDGLTYYTYDPTNHKGMLDTISWSVTYGEGQDTFLYDTLGRVTKQTRTIAGVDFVKEIVAYDTFDRPTQIKNPNNELVEITYDREGENKLKVDGLWVVTDVKYNQRGQLTLLNRAHSQDTRQYYYGKTGTDGNSNYRMKELRHGGISNSLPDYLFDYDKVGNIIELQTRTGSTDTQTFSYDELNRLKTATGNAPSYNYTYTYDEIGNIQYRSGTGGNWDYTYPTNGTRPHAVTSVVKSGTNFSYGYDDNGNMDSRVDATGTFTQDFDEQNRLERVSKSGSGDTNFYYDPDGGRTITWRPDDTLLFTPYPDYEEEWANAATDLGDLGMGIDCNVFATGTGYIMYSQQNVHTRFAFPYPPNSNNADHFVCVQYVAGTKANPGGWIRHDGNGVLAGFTPVGSDVLIAAVNFTSDTVTDLQGQNYTVSGIQAGYVAGDFHIYPNQWYGGGSIGGDFELLGTFFVQNGDDGNKTKRAQFSFAGQPVAVKENSTLKHIYADHLGSTGAMSNSSGSYIANSLAMYEPFGDWRTEPSATAGDRYYTNHKHNNLGGGADDLGLVYMNARYYVPGIGRFASADTIVPEPTNPQSLNRFSYTRNNPLAFIDPSGHGECDPNNCQNESLDPVRKALKNYCNNSGVSCSGENIGHMLVDFHFLKNLLGYDPGFISLPYHINRSGLAPDDLFAWEGVAGVLMGEHRDLHPSTYTKGSAEWHWFTERMIGDVLGIIQTMVNRAETGGYSSANAAALASGQYASPNYAIGDERFEDFFALAFVSLTLNKDVEQPHQSFAHQDLNSDVRGETGSTYESYGQPYNKNGYYINPYSGEQSICCVDTTGFGHYARVKSYYIVPGLYPYAHR